MLCIGLAEIIEMSATLIGLTSLSLLFASVSYAALRFDQMQRASLELALASEAICLQVRLEQMLRIGWLSYELCGVQMFEISWVFKKREALSLEDRYFSKCRRKILGLPCGESAIEGKLLKYVKMTFHSYRFVKMCNADATYSYSTICFLVSILFCII